MKSNNTPRAERIQRRINNLYNKLYEYEPIPYGGGNPYSKCGYCERSMIEVSYLGHYKDCKIPGIENEIKYYKSLLEENHEKNRTTQN